MQIMAEDNDKYLQARWLARREEILRLDNYRCIFCGSMDELRVHHTYYIEDCDIWDYPTAALVTLCRNCHQEYHKSHKNIYRTNHIPDILETEEKSLERKEWISQMDKAAKNARNDEVLDKINGEATLKVIEGINWGHIKYKDTTAGMWSENEYSMKLTFWVPCSNKPKKHWRKIDYYPFFQQYCDMNTKEKGECNPYELLEMLLKPLRGKMD